jgi:hypothetical protein
MLLVKLFMLMDYMALNKLVTQLIVKKIKMKRDWGIEGQAFYNFIESLRIFIRSLTILLGLPSIATYSNQLKYFFRGFFRNKTNKLHF